MDARSHDVIAPVGQDVRLTDGSTITVRPLTVGQLPRFVKVIRPAFGALVALAPASSSPEADGGQGAPQDAEAASPSVDLNELLGIYAEHGEALNEALSITTGEPRERIEALTLDDGLALLAALYRVNRDFFVQRVLPLLKRQQ